jgi:hypothetical protein
MTEEEARTIMKAYGWTYMPRKRRGNLYIYTERRQGYKKLERYICPLSKLSNLTKQQLIEKLAPVPTEEP